MKIFLQKNTLTRKLLTFAVMKRHSRLLYRLPYCATVLIVVLIAYATLLPSPPGSEAVSLFEGADKVVHCCFGAMLTAAMVFDSGRRRAPFTMPGDARIWYAAMAAMALLAVDEMVQGQLPIGRQSDYLDLLADWGGAALALAALTIISRGSGLRRRGARRPACRG